MSVDNPVPSAEQLAAFDAVPTRRPVVFFYQYSLERKGVADACLRNLTALAAQHNGRLLWAADQEQALVGDVGEHRQAAQFQFPGRSKARDFFQNAEHGRTLQGLSSLQVAVLSAQPGRIALLSRLLARLLPRLPFNNAVDPTAEPGIGTSGTMPTVAALAQLKAHPQQDAPVVMINWLKFRGEAAYPSGSNSVTGKAAYLRYGKAALLATHSIGAKLIFAARYQQMLIGNGGEPGPDLWDEFVLMQYPGRSSFMRMTSLKRYRRALPDREAGLTERGQGLTVARPHAQFVWRA